jgi:hypothetical protein
MGREDVAKEQAASLDNQSRPEQSRGGVSSCSTGRGRCVAVEAASSSRLCVVAGKRSTRSKKVVVGSHRRHNSHSGHTWGATVAAEATRKRRM